VDDRFSDEMFPSFTKVEKDNNPEIRSSEDYVRQQLDSVSSDLSKYVCMDPDCG